MPYLNPALTLFRQTVDFRWPNRDRRSDGWIGDPAHQRRSSDHNPDDDGSVDAWDMDADGPDVWACIDAFQRHEAAGYWIFQDTIAHRGTGWRRESYAYAGPNRNRHTSHVHFNTRPSHERSTLPWAITTHNAPGGDDPGARVLRLAQPRMVGRDVRFVQMWIGPAYAGSPDGVYGPRTEAGVKWYQRMRGLAADGIVGPRTWAQMGIRSA